MSEIDIDRMSELARLKLSPEEKEKIAGQLNGILDYFDKLDAVDVSGLEPMSHPFPFKNVWREDEPGPTYTLDEVFMNTEHRKGNQLAVPKVVE